MTFADARVSRMSNRRSGAREIIADGQALRATTSENEAHACRPNQISQVQLHRQLPVRLYGYAQVTEVLW